MFYMSSEIKIKSHQLENHQYTDAIRTYTVQVYHHCKYSE